ncbi:hypothetical protein NF27_EY01150 [Candidatus Jidaibacter acanthamoeba]|uniref:Uncharacterized protein n=1 Tax=Candidatus Jidaibacter acanthamoebae TaxID=86105 RepID=A0A0C1QHN7_9RICK|nr:hypothetical protein [Candidatus Jidaibacter acanthamoeba]KIE05019.1 hypothetical protein NF27_EY01150 [Candidatus Jidaibacter acanthamoeba]
MLHNFDNYNQYNVISSRYEIRLIFRKLVDFNFVKTYIFKNLPEIKEAVAIENDDINAIEAITEKFSILIHAATYSNPETVKYLIEKGANVSYERHINHDAQPHIAIIAYTLLADFKTLDTLIRAGANINLHHFNTHILPKSRLEFKEKLYTILRNISDEYKEKVTSRIMVEFVLTECLNVNINGLINERSLKNIFTTISNEENDRIEDLRINLLRPLHNNIINSRGSLLIRLSLCVSAVAAIAALSYYASPLVAIGVATCLAAYTTYKYFSSNIAYNFITDINIVKEKVSEKAHSFVEAIKDSGEKAISFVRS